jgi:hypothetical protein
VPFPRGTVGEHPCGAQVVPARPRLARHCPAEQAERDREGRAWMSGDVDWRTHNPPVVGSSPTRPTISKALVLVL